MKKTFQLRIEDKSPERLLEATKHEIRQYMRRERRKLLPDGMDFWDFDCRFGTHIDNAQDVHVATLTALIDAVAREGGPQFYLELLARPAKRAPRATTGQGHAEATHRPARGSETSK